MILAILIFAAVLIFKGRDLPRRSVFAVYVIIGAAGVGLLILHQFLGIGYLAERLAAGY